MAYDGRMIDEMAAELLGPPATQEAPAAPINATPPAAAPPIQDDPMGMTEQSFTPSQAPSAFRAPQSFQAPQAPQAPPTSPQPPTFKASQIDALAEQLFGPAPEPRTTRRAASRGLAGGMSGGGTGAGSQGQVPPQDLSSHISSMAQKYGLDENIFMRQLKQESGFNQNAVSPKGARGIGQFMPGTWRDVSAQTGRANINDPYDQIENAAFYLRSNLDQFGSYPLALAAYNAGPEAVKKYGGVPPYSETIGYVRNIMQGKPGRGGGLVDQGGQGGGLLNIPSFTANAPPASLETRRRALGLIGMQTPEDIAAQKRREAWESAVDDMATELLGPPGVGGEGDPGKGGALSSLKKQAVRAVPSWARTVDAAIQAGGENIEAMGGASGLPSVQRIGQAIGEFGRSGVEWLDKNYLQNEAYMLPPEKRKSLWDNPGLMLNPEWLAYNTGEAAVSMVPTVAAYIAMGPAGAALSGGGMEAASSYTDLRKAGVDPSTAATWSGAYGVVSGALNALGAGKMLNAVSGPGFKNNVVRRAISGAWEAGTEWAEEPFQAAAEAMAKGKSWEGVVEDTLEALKNVDVIPGSFLLGAAGSGAAVKKGKGGTGGEGDTGDTGQPGTPSSGPKGFPELQRVDRIGIEAPQERLGLPAPPDDGEGGGPGGGGRGSRLGLPPGQGFIFYDVPESSVFSPELSQTLRQAQLLLPQGQGFLLRGDVENIIADYSPELASKLRSFRTNKALPAGQGFDLGYPGAAAPEGTPQLPAPEPRWKMEAPDLRKMSKDQMVSLAGERGIPLPKKQTKLSVFQAIKGYYDKVNADQVVLGEAETRTPVRRGVQEERYSPEAILARPEVPTPGGPAFRTSPTPQTAARQPLAMPQSEEMKGEAPNAQGIRSDQGQVYPGGNAQGQGSREGGENLEPSKSTKPGGEAARQGATEEVARGEIAQEETAPAPPLEGENPIAIAQQSLKTPLDIAAHEAASSPLNDKTPPTTPQIKADNAELGHFSFQGIPISIESPIGSVRKDVNNDPPRWQRIIKEAHYGRIKGVRGRDKDLLDVFVRTDNPGSDGGKVFIIDQVNPETGKFDELKVVLGSASEEQARQTYLANYPEGWQGLGAITEFTMSEFKTWLRSGDATKRVGKKAPKVIGVEGEGGKVEFVRQKEDVDLPFAAGLAGELAERKRRDAEKAKEAIPEVVMPQAQPITPSQQRTGPTAETAARRPLKVEGGEVVPGEQAEPALPSSSQSAVPPSPPSAPAPPFTISDLSDKSIIVRGDYAANKDRISPLLKKHSGLYNAKNKGWVFPKKNEGAVREALGMEGKEEVAPPIIVEETLSPGLEYKKFINGLTKEEKDLGGGMIVDNPRSPLTQIQAIKDRIAEKRKEAGKQESTPSRPTVEPPTLAKSMADATQEDVMAELRRQMEERKKKAGGEEGVKTGKGSAKATPSSRPTSISTPPPTPQAKLESAADHMKAIADGIKKINAIFGEEGAISIKPPSTASPLDETKWRQIRPILDEMWGHAVATGQDVKDFVSLVLDSLSMKAAPYFERYIEEKFSGKEKSDADTTSPGQQEEVDKDLVGNLPPEGLQKDEGGRDVEPVRGGDGQPDEGGIPSGDRQRAERADLGENPGNQRGADSVPDQAPGEVGDDLSQVPPGTGSPSSGRGRGRIAKKGSDYSVPAGGLKREGSWLDAAKRNVDIIELAVRIEAEKRTATPAEQELLSKYVGFGAGEIRNKLFPAHRDTPLTQIWPNYSIYDQSWKDLAERLSKLPEAWQKTILQSTQYAHYTSEGVTRQMWAAAQHLGFTGGRVLEPGMGIGNFFMTMPEDLKTVSTFTGIEFDGPTAAIAKHLLPRQQVLHDDYTKRKLPKNFFDFAIGNPPFASIPITNDPDYAKYEFSLHDYFFAKTVDLVRPGGMVAFITSRYTMDRQGDKARKYLNERADLVGAIRLPQMAFQDNAGTSVVTDVLFFRKRKEGEEPGGEAWSKHVEIDTKDGPVNINEYYAAHPEMILGQVRKTGHTDDVGRRIGGERGYDQPTVISYYENYADLDAAFAEATKKLPKNVFSVTLKDAESIKRETEAIEFNPKIRREGALYLDDKGKVRRVQGGVGIDFFSKANIPPAKHEWFKDFVSLKDAVNAARFDQYSDGPWEASLKKLQKAYDKFRAKHGPILDYTTRSSVKKDEDGNEYTVQTQTFKNKRFWSEDYDSALITQLEKITEEGEIVKSAFLTERTIGKPVQAQVKTIHDAMAVSLDATGKLDLDDIATRMGISRDEAIETLDDLIYKDVAGAWILSDEYLSGDVVKKLEEVKVAAELDPSLERNIEALQKVQPKPLGHGQIRVLLGSGWIPDRHVTQFATEVLNAGEVSYDRRTETWTVAGGNRRSERTSGQEYGTDDRSPSELLEAVLNGRSVVVKTSVSDGHGGHKMVTNPAATEAANDVMKKMKEKFSSWIWTDSDRTSELLEIYNRTKNNIAPRRFNGSHLTLPGVSLKYQLHEHQKRAIWRIIQTGDTYLGHSVGAGKTIEMIAAGMEMKRLGLIKHPWYVVPNHMLEQFANEFMELYPLANVMTADKESFHKDKRKAFIAQATLNSPDAVIVTHSAFERIGVKEESVAPIRNALVNELEAALDDTEDSDRIRRSALQRQIEIVERRFDSITGSSGKDVTVPFEETGADFLFVDECFSYDTLIETGRGFLPIGDIVEKQMDVNVKSYNFETNALEWKPIVNWHRNTRKTILVEIVHEAGSFICTTKHNIWTGQGYIEAGNLEVGEELFVLQEGIYSEVYREARQKGSVLLPGMSFGCNNDHKNMPELQERILISDQGVSERQEKELLHCILPHSTQGHISGIYGELQEKDAEGLGQSPNKGTVNASPLDTDEEQEPNAQSRNKSESVSGNEGESIVGKGGEWLSSSSSSTASSRGNRIHDRIYNEYTSDQAPNGWSSESLQIGLSESDGQVGNRGGWELTQTTCETGHGPEERESIKSSRVVGVKVLEQGSNGEYQFCGRAHQIVYDIEVEGNHNYFANGVLVSNCHNYRKLDFHTNRKLKGIDPNGAKKSMDMYVKVKFLDSKNPGRSHVFASGTPLTNTIGEMYSLMRFFIEDRMQEEGMSTFDGWASTFGDSKVALEPNAAGNYENVERFATFVNVPELMSRVRSFMDVLTSDQLGSIVTRPDIEGGTPEIVVVPSTPEQTAYREGPLSQRVAASKAWRPSFQQRNNPDPMIAIISEGRKASIDPRFFDHTIPENTPSKLNKMADEIIAEYKRTKLLSFVGIDGKKEAKRGGVQIVFYNLGFGAQLRASNRFDAREALTKRLVSGGVKRDEIAWFDDADTDAKKERVFKEARAGNIRVVIGSAKKMGTGVNIQKRLTAMHYLDPPWYPADFEQPQGRIVRQGNQNEAVRIKLYATKGSYDETMWSMVARKQKQIDQAFSGDASVRNIEDISEASSYEMAAALASGDQRVLQLAGLNQDIDRLDRLAIAHQESQHRIAWELESLQKYKLPRRLERLSKLKAARDAANEGYMSYRSGTVGNDKTFDQKEKNEFGEAIRLAYNAAVADHASKLKKNSKGGWKVVGTIAKLNGKYDLRVNVNSRGENIDAAELEIGIGPLWFVVETGRQFDDSVSAGGLITRAVNVVNRLDRDIREIESDIEELRTEERRLSKVRGAPFEYEAERAGKIAEKNRLEAELVAEGVAANAPHGVVVGAQAPPGVVSLEGEYGEESAARTTYRTGPTPGAARGYTNLYSGFPVDELIREIRAAADMTASKMESLLPGIMPRLTDLGTRIIHQGHNTARTFKAELERVLNAGTGGVNGAFDAVRRYVLKIFAAAQRAYAKLPAAVKNEWGTFAGPKATWWEGAEGKFSSLYDRKERFEIDDSKAKWRLWGNKDKARIEDLWGQYYEQNRQKPIKLAALLDHPELYRQYPDAKNIKVMFKRSMPGDSTAQYSAGTDIISLPRGYDNKTLLKSALHEIQHAIQEREGFARGGSPDLVRVEDVFKNDTKLAAIQKKMDDLSFYEGADWDSPEMLKLRKEEDDYMESSLVKRFGKDYGMEIYNRLSGEIEARDVAARADLTPEQRRKTAPYSSENIAPEDAIVRFGLEGGESGGGVQMAVNTEQLRATLTPPLQSEQGAIRLPQLPKFPNWSRAKAQRASTGDAEIDAALNKIGPAQKTTKEKLDAALDNWKLKAEQGIFDRFASLKALSKSADVTNIQEDPYVAATLATSLGDMLATMMNHGVPQWKEGAVWTATRNKGLAQVFEPVADQLDMFLGWMVGKRAEKLMAEGRENYFTDAEIQALKRIITLPGNRAKFLKVEADYIAFKKGVLDFAESSGVINAEERLLWDHDEYVPFYRIMEETQGLKGPRNKSSIASQYSGIKKLKGGESRLGDIFVNIMMNFSHLVDASVKNHATELSIQAAETMGVAVKAKNQFKPAIVPGNQIKKIVEAEYGPLLESMGIDTSLLDFKSLQSLYRMFQMTKPQGPDVIHVLRDGKPVYYHIQDALVLRSLSAVNERPWGGPAMKAMRTAKRLLTRGVTADPGFMIANLTRDTLSAWVVSPDFKAGVDSVKGVIKTFREDEDYVAMQAAGAAFSGGYAFGHDLESAKREVEKLNRKYKVDGATVLDSVKKMWAFWEKFGSRFENATRTQIYANIRERGGTHVEAAYEAKRIMDYSKRGDWMTIKFLCETVPFFGARLQGAQRLYHGYRENPRGFATKGMILMGATLALYAMNADDDRYKELEEWDKDNYYHFLDIFEDGDHFRLPKPFEVGAIFSTIPERLAEWWLGEGTAKDFAKRMLFTLNQTFSWQPPQLIGPMIEQYANKSFFTGRPIEGQSLQSLQPGARRDPWTGETVSVIGEAANVSPKRMEAMMRGYFGTLGIYALMASDVAMRWMYDYPDPPTSRIDDLPVIRRFVQEDPARHTKYVTSMYEMIHEVDQLYATVRRYEKTMEPGKAGELIEQERRKLAYKDTFNKVQRQFSMIDQEIRNIHLRRDLTPEMKRKKIDELIKSKNEIARSVYEGTKAAFK